MAQDSRSNPSFVLKAIQQVAIEDIPIPEITDPYDVIVHIGQTGICGSDIHYWQRGRIGDFILNSPIVLGHESAGRIVSVGKAVKSLKAGDMVAIEPGVPCRHCNYCRSGSYNLCPDTVFAATPPHNGTLSRFYKTSADFCYRLPDHLNLEDGALCEPVACAVQICRVGLVRGGQNVVVFGCGPIGLLVQSVAKAFGARYVLGVDINKGRLEMAKSVMKSADDVFEPPQAPAGLSQDEEMEFHAKVAALIKEEFNLGDGPDVVIDATGAQSCLQIGVQLCKKGGMYVQAGMGKENAVFPIMTACIRDLTIRGSIRYVAGVYPTAIDLVASGKVQPQKLVTHRFPFEKAEEAFETVKKGGEGVMKVLIEGVHN
ncbi:chlorophyll synthesis pathway protein BchC [Cladophialophora immunda]|uniref:D-xylulose reductase n=1 Tax=Cladophialophora immunda TaxID=569365 RepID=A0A0D2AI26_9EURO|nr:chlorophyll synthesis pathway protein BchC [Cladophialophora immunda]KIW24537.1 chlorophyll synthesis pathway protein BchC [Cladophialophora immunda]